MGRPAHHPEFASYECEVGHGGSQEHLEQGLDPTKVASLADAKLHQPGDAVRISQ